jgi:hypothetical protein
MYDLVNLYRLVFLYVVIQRCVCESVFALAPDHDLAEGYFLTLLPLIYSFSRGESVLHLLFSTSLKGSFQPFIKAIQDIH